MKRLKVSVFISLIALVMISCSEDSSPVDDGASHDPELSLTSATECKLFMKHAFDDRNGSSESAMLFTYDRETQTLSLKHENAGFNCCPGVLGADMRINGDVITITEHESEAACRCNCLYDLDLKLTHLAAQVWHIVVEEPYRHVTDTPMEFEIDLASESEGEHRVPRHIYPWGM
ncbi:hypothetical protein KQI65_13710 [bacterium]|nr:hypothetical protein [bacterium]